MLKDAHGLNVTGANAAALEAYERALYALRTYRGDPVALLDEAIATDELARYRAAGGVTLVDQTTLGLYPDLPALRRASLASGVRIVAGTGPNSSCGESAGSPK